MLHRFLTFVLFGVLSLTALAGFEERSGKREPKQGSQAGTTNAPSDDDVHAKDDGNPWPTH